MYFGVFLLQPSLHVVIPKTWIEGIDENWEKFVNNSLNHNQIFRCFYSKEPNALDNQSQPNVNFAPNFKLDLTEFPNEGCYLGKLVFFKQNYDAAVKRLKRRRSIAPGLYNERRLYEKPIPRQISHMEGEVNDIPVQENENSQIDSGTEQEELTAHTESTSPERQIENVLINENDDPLELTFNDRPIRAPSPVPSLQNDPLFNDQNNVLSSKSGEIDEPSTSNAFDNVNLLQTTQDESLVHNITYQIDQSNNIDALNCSLDANADTEATCSEVNIKAESDLVMQQPESNRKELEALLNDEEVVVGHYEDVVYTHKRNVTWKPFEINTEGLIKYENDIVSGSMPYKAKKNGRIYMVGEKLVFIEKEVIDTLKQWNTQSDRQTEQYDKLLVQALLLCCVGAEDLESGNVGEGVEEFIKSFLRVRAGNDDKRIGFLDKYMQEFLSKKRKDEEKRTTLAKT